MARTWSGDWYSKSCRTQPGRSRSCHFPAAAHQSARRGCWSSCGRGFSPTKPFGPFLGTRAWSLAVSAPKSRFAQIRPSQDGTSARTHSKSCHWASGRRYGHFHEGVRSLWLQNLQCGWRYPCRSANCTTCQIWNSNVGYKYLLCKGVPSSLVGGLADNIVDCVTVSTEVALDCLLEEPVEVVVTNTVNLRFHLDSN